MPAEKINILGGKVTLGGDVVPADPSSNRLLRKIKKLETEILLLRKERDELLQRNLQYKRSLGSYLFSKGV